MLSGMKVIKLYAWEAAFEEKVERLRKEEVSGGICFNTVTYSVSSTSDDDSLTIR